MGLPTAVNAASAAVDRRNAWRAGVCRCTGMGSVVVKSRACRMLRRGVASPRTIRPPRVCEPSANLVVVVAGPVIGKATCGRIGVRGWGSYFQ